MAGRRSHWMRTCIGVVAAVLLAACPGLRAQDCPPDPRPIVVPRWAEIFTESRPGIFGSIAAGVEKITDPEIIRDSAVLRYPESNQGALSTSVYPPGPPWAFNAAASSICPEAAPGADCAGKRIPRNPGEYLRSGYEPH